MTLLAPIWLLGLLPWAAVTLYLLRGRRRQERVPFLALWLGPVQGPRPRRKLGAPPVALAAALLALLLALLAAARPRVAAPRAWARVTVVIDRGASMSAIGRASPRFVEGAEAVAEELARQRVASVALHTVPGRAPVTIRPAELPAAARRASPTALDTSAALDAAVAGLREGGGPVVLISDRTVGGPREGLVQVAPAGKVRDAGIVAVAVRASPSAQAMVRLRNDTSVKTSRVEVESGGEVTGVSVDLPADGGTTDVFVDVPRLGDAVSVRLVLDDAFGADNEAWLLRTGSWPRVEARADVGPELNRMIEVYTRSRPPGDESATVVVARDLASVPPGTPAAVLAAATEVAGGPVELAAHPVTRDLAERFVGESVRLSHAVPEGWHAVVRVGGRTAIAVREQPARQVWVGFDSSDWARRPEFVVFWANVFDWLGASGGPSWRADAVGALEGAWRRVDVKDVGAEPGLWPGLYERAGDGARRAVNATDVTFPIPPATTGWREQLAEAVARSDRGRELAPLLLTASVACLALAAVAWPGARPRRAPAAMS